MLNSSAEDFVRIYSKSQQRIMRFIQCLVPNHAEAEDVLQETSVVLWKKWSEFDPKKDFVKWACGIAKYETFRILRQKKKNGTYLNEEVLNQIAEAALAEATQVDRLSAGETALKSCLQELPESERNILKLRYQYDQTIIQIAIECNRPKSSIHDTLVRIRERLLRCVRKRLEA